MRRSTQIARCLGVASLLTVSTAFATTRTVGPGGAYAKPCAAIAEAADGDTIEIDAAGSYAGDVCQISKNGLTLRGVNGRPKIDAAGQSSGGKAIWVVSGNDTTIENVEFSGATVADANGAGIRQEGANLTVRGAYFHDNQDGILAGDNAGSQILIENSEFDHNGAGDGYSHNLYVNHVARFTFRYNYSHRAVVGHLLKSRAAETYVLYNRLTGESDGTESYELDVPNGGKTYVIGNIVEQGANTGNPSMLAYGEEGKNAANPSDALIVASNTFVNDHGSGTFVFVDAGVTTPARLVDNIFTGGGTTCTQSGAVESGSFTGKSPGFSDALHYDYHLVDGSPCVGAGVAPGSDGSYSLLPAREYVHPASSEARTTVGVIDIGAFELGGAAPGDAGTGEGDGAPPGSGGASSTGGTATGGTPSGGTASGASGTGATASGASGTGATASGASGTGATASGGEEAGNAHDVDGGGTAGKVVSSPSSSSGCRIARRGTTTSDPWSYAVVTLSVLLLTARKRAGER
jgi:hypothetical protein